MSLSLVQSRALLGLEAAAVTVEVHLANGLPSFTIVARQLDFVGVGRIVGAWIHNRVSNATKMRA